MRKLGGSVILATLALSLAACGGGATVENSGESTVAPLTRQPSSASSSAASSASSTASPTAQPTDDPKVSGTPTSSVASERPGGVAAPAPKDQPAQEVTAVPSDSGSYDKREQRYVGELKKQGINTDGVEDQMLGAAEQVCTSGADPQQNYLIGAIAGQIVEQKRTDKPAEEVSNIIAKAAKDAYC